MASTSNSMNMNSDDKSSVTSEQLSPSSSTNQVTPTVHKPAAEIVEPNMSEEALSPPSTVDSPLSSKHTDPPVASDEIIDDQTNEVKDMNTNEIQEEDDDGDSNIDGDEDDKEDAMVFDNFNNNSSQPDSQQEKEIETLEKNIETMRDNYVTKEDIETDQKARKSLPLLQKARNERCFKLVDYLNSYEELRKQTLEESFNNTKVYWKAVVMMLENALVQERQFLTMLVVKKKAERAYSDSMLSISLALSQTSSQRIIEETEQFKKNQKQKEIGGKLLSPKHQILAQSSAFAVKDQPAPTDKRRQSKSGAADEDDPSKSIYCEDLPEHVKAVLESQISMGRVYHTFASKVEELHDKVDTSFNELQRLVSELKNEGAETLKSVDAARQNALDCFANFYGAATTNSNDSHMNGSASGDMNRDGERGSRASVSQAGADNSESTDVFADAWLQESLYRCAVKECSIAWQTCSQVLKKLFSQAHMLEQARRLRTLKYVQALTSAQSDMWIHQLPPCHASAAAAVGKASHAKELISKSESAKDIKGMVKKYALEIQKKECNKDGNSIKPSHFVNTDSISDELFPTRSNKKKVKMTEKDTHIHDDGYSSEDDELYEFEENMSKMSYNTNQGSAAAGGGAGTGAGGGGGGSGGGGASHLSISMKQLQSPMVSPLLMRARVVQRKDVGTIYSGWITCFAMLTFDSFLHIYDIPTQLIKNYEKKLKEEEKMKVTALKKSKEAEKRNERQSIGKSKVENQNQVKSDRSAASSSLDVSPPIVETRASSLISTKNIVLFDDLCNMTKPGHYTPPKLFRSINIKRSNASWGNDGSVFMIEESYIRKNAGFFLSKETTRSITLKCENEEEMVDWCVQIKHAKN